MFGWVGVMDGGGMKGKTGVVVLPKPSVFFNVSSVTCFRDVFRDLLRKVYLAVCNHSLGLRSFTDDKDAEKKGKSSFPPQVTNPLRPKICPILPLPELQNQQAHTRSPLWIIKV